MPTKSSSSLFTKEIKVTFGLLLAAGVLILVTYFLILPLFNEAQALKREITDNQELLTKLETKNQQLDKAQRSYEAVAASASAIIDEVMPNYSNTPLVMSIIEKIGSEIIEDGQALVIESISVNEMPNDLPENSNTQLETAESLVRINLVGGYEAVQAFINKIKNLRHNFSVEQITISAPKSTNLSQLLTINLSLRYYYFK